MTKLKLIVCMMAGAFMGNTAMAVTLPGVGSVEVYGTLSVDQSDNDRIQRVDNLKLQYGESKQLSLKDSSVVGVSASIRPLELFNVNVDVSAKQRADKTFRPEFREASIESNYGLGIRSKVGVMPLEVFKYSKYQDRRINLTTTGVAQDIYSQMPFQQYVGGELAYTNSMLVPMTVKVFGGTAKTQFALAQDMVSDLSLNRMVGANVVAKAGPLTLWGSYVNGRLAVKDEDYKTVMDIIPMYEAIYTGISDLRNRVTWDNVNTGFGSIGAKYEDSHIVLDAELARSDSYAWNLTAGYKLGRATPYIAYSGIKVHDTVPENTVDGTNDPALYTVVQSLRDQTKVKQHTESVGMKYQLNDKVAYKLQVNQMKINDGFGVNKISTEGTTDSRVLSGTVAVDFKF